jgi:hypothetical protein
VENDKGLKLMEVMSSKEKHNKKVKVGNCDFGYINKSG